MPLYNNIITIFNYDYLEEKFYPTLIKNVECQYYFGIDRLPEYNSSRDRCLSIIKYQIIDGFKVSDNKIFLIKDEWATKQDKANYFTFQTDKDFFAIGDYSDIQTDSYEEFKNSHTHKAFLINEYRDFESVLQHWEVYGG